MSELLLQDVDIAALGRTAVIMGGNSAERPVSLKSGAAVLAALQRAGVDAFGLDLGGEQPDNCPLTQLLNAEFDRAFLILHGRGGEDGVIQGVLEMMGKPYTGSGVQASAIGMDKLQTKLLWAGAGLPTPSFRKLDSADLLESIEQALGFPMMIKPAHEGSSIGMSRVTSTEELAKAYADAAEYDSCVLAEQWMSGSEFTVAILNGRALPVIKLETDHAFYDFEAKYQSNDTRYRFDHGLTAEQEARIKQLAEQAFAAVGCKTWGRVDVMQDAAGNFQLLEINTAPGMTDHSLVPMAAAEAGISFEQLVVQILQGAV